MCLRLGLVLFRFAPDSPYTLYIVVEAENADVLYEQSLPSELPTVMVDAVLLVEPDAVEKSLQLRPVEVNCPDFVSWMRPWIVEPCMTLP